MTSVTSHEIDGKAEIYCCVLSLACFICHLSKSLQFTNVRAGAFIADDPLGLLLQPLYIDYSKFPRVVCFYWKSRTIFLFYVATLQRCCLESWPSDLPLCPVCGVSVVDVDRAGLL